MLENAFFRISNFASRISPHQVTVPQIILYIIEKKNSTVYQIIVYFEVQLPAVFQKIFDIFWQLQKSWSKKYQSTNFFVNYREKKILLCFKLIVTRIVPRCCRMEFSLLTNIIY
eukprot:TRINITY_DN25814_c1_g2_i1.p4 TRINITY_DN25814_c1_g2~~TRINITY_DN25814_c1_g2_i1.p4  ORF type:complete len:114 (-),score=2.55 TRINITY_DN25814_c1_g2_i1:13-354(-)